MISYYVLEEYDFNLKCWFKIRNFSVNELNLAKDYLIVFKNKEFNKSFRLVGVVCV